MKKLFISILILSGTILNVSAQKTETALSCGTQSAPIEEVSKRTYFGDNKKLLDVLSRNGLELPNDYFKKLDNHGLYNGENLPLSEVLSKSQINLENNSADRIASGTTHYVRLKFWVYRNSGGIPELTEAEVDNLLNDMQQLFRDNGAPIEFYKMCPITFIQDNRFYDIDNEAEKDDMWDTYYDDNSINVHIIGTAQNDEGTSLAGLAQNPGNIMYLANESATTFAHELGHNLGLEHTHNGRCNDDNSGCGDCRQESVDRFRNQEFGCINGFQQRKCEVNGDYLCDTPADPNLFEKVDRGPRFVGCYLTSALGNDNWGEEWSPSLINIMSYSTSSCRISFTYGQVGVMLNTIETESDLDFISTNAGYSISGPTSICAGNNYTFSVPNLPNANSYTWSIPSSWTINSGQGSNSVSVYVSNWVTNPTIYVRPNCGYGSRSKTLAVSTFTLNITGPAEMPADGTFRSFSTNYYSNASSYTWTFPSGWGMGAGQGTSNVTLYANPGASPGYVGVSTQICGQTVNGQKYMNIGYGGGTPALMAEENENLIDEIFTSSIKIYPNPTTNCVKVLSDQSKAIEKVELYEVANGRLFDVKINNQNEINLLEYPSGAYVIKIYTKNQVTTRKLLKQ